MNEQEWDSDPDFSNVEVNYLYCKKCSGFVSKAIYRDADAAECELCAYYWSDRSTRHTDWMKSITVGKLKLCAAMRWRKIPFVFHGEDLVTYRGASIIYNKYIGLCNAGVIDTTPIPNVKRENNLLDDIYEAYKLCVEVIKEGKVKLLMDDMSMAISEDNRLGRW